MTKLTQSELHRVISLDAKMVSGENFHNYQQANRHTYELLCNTWSAMYELVHPELGKIFRERLISQGAIATIKECSEIANSVTHDESVNGLPHWLAWAVGDLSRAELLQLLRYAKRFSPLYADNVQLKGLEDFLSLNRELRKRQRLPYSQKVVSDVSDVLADMLKYFDDIWSIYEEVHTAWPLPRFTSGVAADASKTPIDKLTAFKRYQPGIGDYQYLFTPSKNVSDHIDYPLDQNPNWYAIHPYWQVRVKAVPKSYKTPRIIGEETVYRQSMMAYVAECIEASLKMSGYWKYINIYDQDRNREMCRYAALHGRYATVDQTSASDSMSKSVCKSVFPQGFVHVCERFLGRSLKFDTLFRDYPIVMEMWSTSGSRLCFLCLAMFSFAVAKAATTEVACFVEEELYDPISYGDDLIVDELVYETAVDYFTALGLTINCDKSFAVGSYRESCGVEFYGEENTTSCYFPREALDFSEKSIASTISSVIQLQHRLCSVDITEWKKGRGCWEIASYVSDFVRRFIPNMTSSPVGSDSQDLWEIQPKFPTGRAPWDFKKEDFPQNPQVYMLREKHMTLRSVVSKSTPSSTQIRDLEMYLYTKFLLEGPRYESPLDELLGVSAPVDRNVYYRSGSETWDYVKV